jgi:hypothetical protein
MSDYNNKDVEDILNTKIESYGDYQSDGYGRHTMKVYANGNTFWFSYSTLVAFRKGGGRTWVHKNDWGTTTGRHLNWIDDGDKKSRLSSQDFNAKFAEEFGGSFEITTSRHGVEFRGRPVKL